MTGRGQGRVLGLQISSYAEHYSCILWGVQDPLLGSSVKGHGQWQAFEAHAGAAGQDRTLRGGHPEHSGDGDPEREASRDCHCDQGP